MSWEKLRRWMPYIAAVMAWFALIVSLYALSRVL